jgi:hypothetical protein
MTNVETTVGAGKAPWRLAWTCAILWYQEYVEWIARFQQAVNTISWPGRKPVPVTCAATISFPRAGALEKLTVSRAASGRAVGAVLWMSRQGL